MNRISRASLVLLLTVLVSACATLHSPRISELRANPGRYQNHSVSISGVVTSMVLQSSPSAMKTAIHVNLCPGRRVHLT